MLSFLEWLINPFPEPRQTPFTRGDEYQDAEPSTGDRIADLETECERLRLRLSYLEDLVNELRGMIR